MTNVRVHEVPRDEEGIARFTAVAASARDADPVLGAGPPDDDASALALTSDEGGAVPAALFVASAGNLDVARCAAMAPPVVPGVMPADAPCGAIGFWSACPGHPDAAQAVLAAAQTWLFHRGLDAMGPVDLSTWHRYRFVVEGFDNGRFLLEPWNRPDDVTVWTQAGFEPVLTHATVAIPVRHYDILAAAEAQALSAGITFTDLSTVSTDEALGALYDVVSAGFAGKSGFLAVPRERFFSTFGGLALLLSPGMSFLARAPNGTPLGFAFAYPDWLEPMRADVMEPTTVVLKTLARRPDAPAFLGYALCHHHMVSVRALGFSVSLFALMERWAVLMRIGRMHHAGPRIFKKYALFRCGRPTP